MAENAYEGVNVKFVEGLTDEQCDLMIIDDMMDANVVDFFTKKVIIETLALFS